MCMRVYVYVCSVCARVYICMAYVREFFYLDLLSVYYVCVCVSICVCSGVALAPQIWADRACQPFKDLLSWFSFWLTTLNHV